MTGEAFEDLVNSVFDAPLKKPPGKASGRSAQGSIPSVELGWEARSQTGGSARVGRFGARERRHRRQSSARICVERSIGEER